MARRQWPAVGRTGRMSRPLRVWASLLTSHLPTSVSIAAAASVSPACWPRLVPLFGNGAAPVLLQRCAPPERCSTTGPAHAAQVATHNALQVFSVAYEARELEIHQHFPMLLQHSLVEPTQRTAASTELVGDPGCALQKVVPMYDDKFRANTWP